MISEPTIAGVIRQRLDRLAVQYASQWEEEDRVAAFRTRSRTLEVETLAGELARQLDDDNDHRARFLRSCGIEKISVK